MKITKIILTICLFITSATILYAQAAQTCPPCYKDNTPLKDNGRVSAGDARRKVFVTADYSMRSLNPFNPKLLDKYQEAIHGSKNCNPDQDPNCLRGALKEWNDIKPGVTTLAPYYLQNFEPYLDYIDPPGVDTKTHITIMRMRPGEYAEYTRENGPSCAYTQADVYTTGTTATIVLPFESINWTKQAIQCVIAHEMGHVMGLADPAGGFCGGTIMDSEPGSGDPINNCVCTRGVMEKDRQAVVVHYNERAARCKRSVFEPKRFFALPVLPTPTPAPSGCQDCQIENSFESEVVVEEGQTCYYYYNCSKLRCCGQIVSTDCQLITNHCVEH